MKKILAVSGVLALLLAAVAGYGYYWLQQQVSSGELTKRIATLIREKTGREATLGAISIAGPFSVEIADFRLKGAPPAGSDLALKAVQISLAPEALLHGRVALDSVTLVHPDFKIVRKADGTTNLSELAGQGAGPATGGAATGARPAAAPTDLSALPFRRINVAEGQLQFHDEAWTADRTIQLFDIHGDVTMPASGSSEVGFGLQSKLEGGVFALNGTYDAAKQSLRAAGRTSSVDVGKLFAMLPMSASMPVRVKKLPLESRLSFVFLNGLKELEASASFSGGEISAGPRDLPVTDIKGAIKVAGGTLDLTDISGNVLGAIPVKVAGKVTDLLGATNLALAIEVSEADLASLAGTGLGAVPKGARGSVSGKVSVQGAAAAPRIEGEVVPHDFTWVVAVGGASVPIEIKQGSLEITPQKIATKGLAVLVGGQPIDVAASVDDYATAPAWKAQFKAASADVSSLLALAPEETRAKAAKYSLAGKLTLTANASGNGTAFSMKGELTPEGLTAKAPLGSTDLPLKVTSGKIRFTQAEAVSENLGVEIAETAAQVSFKVTELTGGTPHLSAKASVPALPVERTIASLSEEQRAKLTPYHLNGNVAVDVSAQVHGQTTELSGSVDATGLRGQVEQAGQKVSFEVEKGRIVPRGDHLTTEGLVIAFNLGGKEKGASSQGRITIAGEVDPLAQPAAVALKIRGDKMELAALSSMVPGLPVQLEGTTSFSGTLKGPVTALSSDIGIDLKGIVVHHPSLALPLTGRGGRVGFDGKQVQLQNARFGLGKSEFSASGSVEDPMGAGVFQAMKVSGTLSMADLPQAVGMPASLGMGGEGRIEGELRGDKSAAELVGRGQFAVLVLLPGGGSAGSKIELKDVSAKVEAKAGSFKLSPIAATLYGGEVKASVDGAPGKPMACAAKLSGADFGQMMGDLRNMPGAFSGTLDADAKVSITPGAGVTGMEGQGLAVIHSLVLNGKELSKGMPGADVLKKVQDVGKIGAIAGALGGGKGLFGKLGGKATALGDKYGAMIDFAMQQHEFGNVTYDFQIQQGKLSGPVKTVGQRGKIDGNLEVDLATSVAVGQFALVATDGTHRLEIPDAILNTANRVPMSTQGGLSSFRYTGPEASPAAGAAASPETSQPATGEPEAPASPVESLLGKSKVGKALGGLLGGGQGGQTAPAAGQPSQPSQPTQAESVIGGLKSLFGKKKKKPAAPPPQPAAAAAESAPAPAPAEGVEERRPAAPPEPEKQAPPAEQSPPSVPYPAPEANDNGASPAWPPFERRKPRR